jgi:cytochrome c556
VQGGGKRAFRAAAAIVLAVATLPSYAVSAASESDAVTYRRHVMKTMSEQAAALGLVLQNRGPAENAASHARTIALTAASAVKAFEAKAPGGEAKADIWRTWPDFEKRLKTLSTGANELAVVAERDGLAAVQAKVMTVLKDCKSCHDAYTLRQGR